MKGKLYRFPEAAGADIINVTLGAPLMGEQKVSANVYENVHEI